MTVGELIKILQSYPEDMIVVDDWGILGPADIRIEKEFYNGDSANPNCEILENVLLIY